MASFNFLKQDLPPEVASRGTLLAGADRRGVDEAGWKDTSQNDIKPVVSTSPLQVIRGIREEGMLHGGLRTTPPLQ